MLKVTKTPLLGVLIIEPKLYEDKRGFFFEAYNQDDYKNYAGITSNFVQDNQSFSIQNTLRGLHYQIQRPQGKLIRVLEGEIFDVVVDIRVGSPSFGKWFSIKLSSLNHKQIWIPEGFAHGFLALSSQANILYKTTDFYFPEHERAIRWNDPKLNIDWPNISGDFNLSEKDSNANLLDSADLPTFKN